MRRVADGQPFSMSAEEFNSHQAAAAFVAAQQTCRGLPKTGFIFEMDRTRPWVVNGTSESIRAFSCVKITGVATTHETTGSDFYSRTPLTIGKPTTDGDSFLILQDGLTEQGVATRALTDGITPAWITFTEEDEDEQTAGLAANSFDLKSGGTGAEILWKPDGTGSLLCVVRLRSVTSTTDNGVYVIVLGAALPAGGSITMPIDGKESTVRDVLMATGESIGIGTTIIVARVAGTESEYVVIAAPCEDAT